MSPSRGSSTIDIIALSGILGSISIACWIVVFTPQIVENFRRSSADALSLTFIIIWLAGDVFNILGAILQGVLPTMVILAVYYTVADLVLLVQCLYYRGIHARQEDGGTSAIVEDEEANRVNEPTERAPLLSSSGRESPQQQRRPMISDIHRSARGSMSSFHSYISSASGGVDPTHLSPATPFAAPAAAKSTATTANPAASNDAKSRSALKATIFNTTALLVVCAAGALGWYISSRASSHSPYSDDDQGCEGIDFTNQLEDEDAATGGGKELHLDLYGQIFGYLCAVLYLGSRIPQLLLNYKRKSTEGVSMLFFLFACVGNATAGTLLLDLLIFGQFWLYRGRGAVGDG
ncbi:MAG: putative vacuolar membrane transporter for cationic amino acids [Ramalina farinacea]|uniref:Vacuolar membrane transporter for cationic amino acids n=1 Tax=Ramalina farinacea TaxID=258253 RepID=A0AA43QHB6_9LECA|nr:putative vacuolar membrane transporter for cationic amino acids [Ramalina farinacea]